MRFPIRTVLGDTWHGGTWHVHSTVCPHGLLPNVHQHFMPHRTDGRRVFMRSNQSYQVGAWDQKRQTSPSSKRGPRGLMAQGHTPPEMGRQQLDSTAHGARARLMTQRCRGECGKAHDVVSAAKPRPRAPTGEPTGLLRMGEGLRRVQELALCVCSLLRIWEQTASLREN